MTTTHTETETGEEMFTPSTDEMRYALSLLAAARVGNPGASCLGTGTLSDPLIPIKVRITGGDGNALSLISAIRRPAHKWLRANANPDEPYLPLIKDAMVKELMGSESYADLQFKVMCLVDAY